MISFIIRKIIAIKKKCKNRSLLKNGIYTKLKNMDITIFSNNCIGGVIYHDFGLEFCSPLINTQLSNSDFVKFCKNYQYYLSLDLQEASSFDIQKISKITGNQTIDFPIGRLDDITILFRHERTFLDAKNNWDRRKLRVSSNVFFIFVDHDCSVECQRNFDDINHRKKLFLSFDEKKRCYCNSSLFHLMGKGNTNNKSWLDIRYGLFPSLYYDFDFDYLEWFLN